ncbi:MAG: hypothetical protein IPM35_08205 [Myxococcales bacterium]|nr:hypothetical protein [Myxococcales bacterium]
MPPPVVTEVDEPEERISFVPEDDIEGGRLHVMYERLRHDDYAGAQLVAQSILEREPDNHDDARQCLEMCTVELRKLYLSRVGDLGRIPSSPSKREDLPQRVSDERATHLLQLVNGLTPLATIVEASGLPSRSRPSASCPKPSCAT